ncbi:MAG: glycosyltransferase, partial [Cytophagales bacterium]
MFNQNHNDFEVIVVNDRSTDETYDFLREYSYTEKRLKVVNINETPYGMSAKKYALTLGFKAAKNEILLLTDADCLPDTEDWISSMATAYVMDGENDVKKNCQVVLSFSGYFKEKGFLNVLIQYETLFTALQFLGLANLRIPYMGVGRNLSYKRSLFFDKGGFKKIMSFIAGDDDLFVQMVANSKNTSIVIDSRAFTRSIPKMSWKEYLVQKKRHLSVGRFYKFRIRLVLGIIFLTQFAFWLFAGYMLTIETFVWWVMGVVIFRILERMFLFYRANKVFKTSFAWYWSPFMELIYIFYYIVAG